LVLFGAAENDRTLFGPTVAAWVQGLGSIAAILGAIWIARDAESRAKRAALASVIRFVQHSHAVSTTLEHGLNQMQAQIDAQDNAALGANISASEHASRQARRWLDLGVAGWPTPFIFGGFEEHLIAFNDAILIARRLAGSLHHIDEPIRVQKLQFASAKKTAATRYEALGQWISLWGGEALDETDLSKLLTM
jgi:hypothetical protein